MADLTKTLRLAHSIIFFASGWKFAQTQPFKALKQVLSPKLGICLNFPNGWLLPAIFRDLLWSFNVSLASFSFSWIRGLYMWTYWKSLRDFLFLFLPVLMSFLLSSKRLYLRCKPCTLLVFYYHNITMIFWGYDKMIFYYRKHKDCMFIFIRKQIFTISNKCSHDSF